MLTGVKGENLLACHEFFCLLYRILGFTHKCSGNEEQMKKLSSIMTEIGFLEE